MFSAVALAFFLYSLAGLRKMRSKEGGRREGFFFSSFFNKKNKNKKKQKKKKKKKEQKTKGKEVKGLRQFCKQSRVRP
jgi:hypothetical protein